MCAEKNWPLAPVKMKPMVLVLSVMVAGSFSQMSLVPRPPFRASSLRRFAKYLRIFHTSHSLSDKFLISFKTDPLKRCPRGGTFVLRVATALTQQENYPPCKAEKYLKIVLRAAT